MTADATAPRRFEWGWTAPLALGAGLALVMMALADNAARQSKWWAEPLYWIALVLLVGPPSARLLMRSPGRCERVALLLMIGVGLYMVKLLASPTEFAFTDELQQMRSLIDVERTHHLFTKNPLVSAYPFYPALLATTSALHLMTGLGSFTCGLILIGFARLVYVLALFAIFDRVTGSARLGAVAALVTMSNPNFTYFDADWAYESLALPMALVTLMAVSRVPIQVPAVRWRPHGQWPAMIVALLLAFATVVTHHMTTAWLVAMLIGWSAAMLIRRRDAEGPPSVPLIAVIVTVAAAAWYAFVARAGTEKELGPALSGAFSSLGDLLHGSTGGKQVFHSSTGTASPLDEQLLGYAAVLVALTLLGAGIWAMWLQRHRIPRLAFVLAALGAVYVPSLVLRLTQAGTETSNRASEFVFVGIGLMAAMAFETALPGRVGRLLGPLRHGPVMWVACLVLFAGGITIGWAGYDRQPGSFEVGADGRSIGREGVAAAKWAATWLPRESRIATDTSDRLLMGSYGRLNPQLGTIDGVRVSGLFLSSTFGSAQRTVITGDKLSYVIADKRLTELPTQTGVFFEGGELNPYRRSRPLPTVTMTKFNRVDGLNRIFDSGSIRVYEAKALLR